MLQAGRVSFLTQFYQEYQALKASENWQGVIDLGLQSLYYSQITEKSSALIQNRLSSCYYYLGKHDEALKYAKNAYQNAVQANDNELKARSLYLFSAIYRMQALKAAGRDRKEYHRCSQANINVALILLSEPDISNFVRAKVYFNAGALAHDLVKNFDAAINYYLQVEELLKNEEYCDDDINRTVMRRIRASAESRRIQSGELISEVKALEIDKKTKTGVHHSLLLSSLLIECEEICEALLCAQEGLEVAKSKSMSTEVSVLSKVIRYIEEGHYQTVNQQHSRAVEEESYQVVTQQPQPFWNESAIRQLQAVNQCAAQQPIFFNESEWHCHTMPQQQPIFLNQSDVEQYQVVTQQPQSFLSKPEINIVTDRQYYK